MEGGAFGHNLEKGASKFTLILVLLFQRRKFTTCHERQVMVKPFGQVRQKERIET